MKTVYSYRFDDNKITVFAHSNVPFVLHTGQAAYALPLEEVKKLVVALAEVTREEVEYLW